MIKHIKQKKKKSKAKSSSSSESSSSSDSSSSETDSEVERRSKKKKKNEEEKKKKHKKSAAEFKSDDLFDVNILNNIKTERITDDEKQITPRKKPREIINVKELQNDFVGNNIHIKKEVEEKTVVDSNTNPELSNKELQQNEKELVTIEADNNVEELNKEVDVQNNVEIEDTVQQKNVEEVERFETVSEEKQVEILENKMVEQLKVRLHYSILVQQKVKVECGYLNPLTLTWCSYKLPLNYHRLIDFSLQDFLFFFVK